MRSIVIYYSQTGSTKKIAEAIHAGMRQVIEESAISAFKGSKCEVSPQELAGYDLIGLGSPWWGYLPPNITAFIDNMVSVEGKHAFPFFTSGSLPSGFMQKIIPLLKRRGLIIIGYNNWYGSEFYPVMPKPCICDGHPDEIDLKEAEDFGREMSERSRRIYSGETHLIPKLPTMREWKQIYGPFLPMSDEFIKILNMTLKQRKINMEKCTECGLCVDNCPTDSIDFSVSPPVFRDSCAACWNCEQICPEGAIEVDFEPFARVLDKSAKKYMLRRAADAEAKGRFRRLVPVEDIGWNTRQFQITGHPRYVNP